MNKSDNFYIKCLSQQGRSPHSWVDENGNASIWQVPHDGQPGGWKVAHTIDIAPHKRGLHVVQSNNIVYFFTGENYQTELSAPVVAGYDCAVAYRARLIKALPVTSRQWQMLGLEFAEMAQQIPTLLEYPEEFRMAPINAFRAAKAALLSLDPHDAALKKRDAIKNLRVVGAQRGRHHLDSWNTSEYLYSAIAAEKSHASVMGLGHYLLEDEAHAALGTTVENLSPYLTKAPDWQATKMIMAHTATAWQNAAAQFKWRYEMSGWRHDSPLREALAELPANPRAEGSTDFGFQVFSSLRLLQNNALLTVMGLPEHCYEAQRKLADCAFFPA